MNNIVPCVGFLLFVFLVLGFIVLMRYLNYQETLKLAEKGLVKPVNQSGNGKGALIWGILITAIGLATTLGLWPLGFMYGPSYPFGFGPWMLAGLLPMFFGIGLILIYVLTRESKPKDDAAKKSDDQSDKL
ncbi:MAG TPA: DUF6249 domain-containing protein [Anaerolineales bacterium]|jgi:hypothetical protein